MAVAKYSALGFMLPASTFVGYAIGYGLDRVFHTGFLRIVFLIIGTVAGFYQLVRELGRQTK